MIIWQCQWQCQCQGVCVTVLWCDTFTDWQCDDVTISYFDSVTVLQFDSVTVSVSVARCSLICPLSRHQYPCTIRNCTALYSYNCPVQYCKTIVLGTAVYCTCITTTDFTFISALRGTFFFAFRGTICIAMNISAVCDVTLNDKKIIYYCTSLHCILLYNTSLYCIVKY